jgi:hypothetical protein
MQPEQLYNEAFEYLSEFNDVDEELITEHLTDYDEKKPESVQEIYRGLLISAQNRRGMPNSIGDVDDSETLLEGFEPERVLDRYDSWKEFFRQVESSDELSPPGRFEIENKNSHWVQFSKSVISAAEFISQFDSVDDFDRFVDGGFDRHTEDLDYNLKGNENEAHLVGLPLLIADQIHGIGFATACDFLKENGYPDYAKPDTHIKDILIGCGVSEDEQSDIEFFYDMTWLAEEVDKSPYEVDKLLWIVGSGRFPEKNDGDGGEFSVDTDKEEFVERVR